MARETIPHKDAIYFCKFHLGKRCFAPFTGGDWPAWIAFCYLLRAYAAGCGYGRGDRFTALRATVHLAQPKVWPVFVQTIPAMLDWGFVAEIWPQLVDGDDRNLLAIQGASP